MKSTAERHDDEVTYIYISVFCWCSIIKCYKKDDLMFDLILFLISIRMIMVTFAGSKQEVAVIIALKLKPVEARRVLLVSVQSSLLIV